MMPFSAHEKQREAQREAAMRERVYAAKVEAGDMDFALARRRIAIMQEIAADYAKDAEKERLI